MALSVETILNSASLEELQREGILPEPYSTAGFFYLYFCKEDYREALTDIVQFADDGVRVWYDRLQNNGESWERDKLAKAESIHCRAVVLYLSENAMRSAFFWRLCARVKERHLPYCAIVLPDAEGNIVHGERLAERTGADGEKRALAHALFHIDVTYIPGNIPYEEKKVALSRIRQNSPFLFIAERDHAALIGVKDKAEETLIVPETVRIGERDYPVKRIAPRAFENCKRLKRIVLPDGIESVGDSPLKERAGGESTNDGRVFKGCSKLTSVRLPASMKVFCFENFANCPSLKEIWVGDNVTSVREGWGSISIGEDLDTLLYLDPLRMYETTESEPHELQRLHLPPLFVRRADGEIFYPSSRGCWKRLVVSDETKVTGCTPLPERTHYTAPEGEHIGELFGEDETIETLDLSAAGDDPTMEFYGCTSLRELILPRALTAIEAIGFLNGASLEELVLPENVTKVCEDALMESAVSTIVSDSARPAKLFAPPLTTGVALYRRRKNWWWKALVVLFCPFIIFGGIFSNFFHAPPAKQAVGIAACLLFFPITFWYFLFRRTGEIFFAYRSVNTVYLKRRGMRRIRLRGFRHVPSDRAGYEKYVRKPRRESPSRDTEENAEEQDNA